ncbi:hypothetical protein ACG97_00295 [Vogesella sp. EB]|uniref:hypothetical protein n=1 Tax=Vogesella sp. EB TaxID=1526735 RepID=UPI00064D6660|nr:hypothetical protein [Vogesella sp. EB]KMJ54765.1 hypothetical protein ACG97_00295 [Vogesella sp. EB]
MDKSRARTLGQLLDSIAGPLDQIFTDFGQLIVHGHRVQITLASLQSKTLTWNPAPGLENPFDAVAYDAIGSTTK